MCRGRDAAAAAAETARATFEQGAAGTDLPSLAVGGSIGLVDAMVGLGLVASKNEARRLVAQGGARIDGTVVTDEAYVVSVAAPVKLSAGKKRHGVLTPA